MLRIPQVLEEPRNFLEKEVGRKRRSQCHVQGIELIRGQDM
jgi:hypothetical protein